jgi:hypothetical protein
MIYNYTPFDDTSALAVLAVNVADTNGVGFHSRSLCGIVESGSYLSYSFSKRYRRHSNHALKLSRICVAFLYAVQLRGQLSLIRWAALFINGWTIGFGSL